MELFNTIANGFVANSAFSSIAMGSFIKTPQQLLGYIANQRAPEFQGIPKHTKCVQNQSKNETLVMVGNSLKNQLNYNDFHELLSGEFLTYKKEIQKIPVFNASTEDIGSFEFNDAIIERLFLAHKSSHHTISAEKFCFSK